MAFLPPCFTPRSGYDVTRRLPNVVFCTSATIVNVFHRSRCSKCLLT
ncbi:unnamed protein product [Periconia digitata]|uniref:Uncharacterized protein n=1 Tax=Periconia digitata TaxID=1303443 RepID=A0A9W4U628_9PLEO|nr:unnamed protein product [Periconia digitata]